MNKVSSFTKNNEKRPNRSTHQSKYLLLEFSSTGDVVVGTQGQTKTALRICPLTQWKMTDVPL